MCLTCGVELDAIERSEVRSADDKQWYIECELLEIERLKVELAMLKEEASKAYAQMRIAEAKGSAKETVHLECRCGAVLDYSGTDIDAVREMVEEFQDKHYNCY